MAVLPPQVESLSLHTSLQGTIPTLLFSVPLLILTHSEVCKNALLKVWQCLLACAQALCAVAS